MTVLTVYKEAVETLANRVARQYTQLKQGVNEIQTEPVLQGDQVLGRAPQDGLKIDGR